MRRHRGNDEVVRVVVCLGQRVGFYELKPLVATLLNTAGFPFFIEDFREDRGDLFIHSQILTLTSTTLR